MQVASLLEVLHSTAPARNSQTSAHARAAVRADDFASILARRREACTESENASEASEHPPVAPKGPSEESREQSVRERENDTSVSETERDRAVSSKEEIEGDDKDAMETYAASVSPTPVTEQATAQAKTSDPEQAVSSVAGVLAASGGTAQDLTIQQKLVAWLQRLASDAAQGETSIEEIAAKLASSGQQSSELDGDGAVGFTQTLLQSLKEGKETLQTSLQSASAPADTADISNIPPVAYSQDDVDVSGLAKNLAITASEQTSAQAGLQQEDAPVEASVVETTEKPKAAEAPDSRLLTTQATAQKGSATQALAATKSSDSETATLASLDKVVLQNIRYLVSRGERSLTVQLSPPSLGELHIQVSSVKNALNVSMSSGNAAVREVLETHALGLREALAKSGVEVTNVAVLPALAGQAAGQQYSGYTPPDFSRSLPTVHSYNTPGAETEQASARVLQRAAPHGGTLNLFV